MSISSIRFNSSQLKLIDYSLIKVTGEDRESFFQGQITSDLSALSLNEGHLTARLSRVGKLQSVFFIAKLKENLFLLCPKLLVNSIKEDFEKFIIMDDVTLENVESDLWINFNYFLDPAYGDNQFFDFNYYGISARLTIGPCQPKTLTDQVELEKIRILNGWPLWGVDINSSQFINDSFLNNIAISYKKGCFLGQETASKIENNRGAAYFPVLLKLQGECDLSSFKNKDFNIVQHDSETKVGKILYQVNDLIQVLLFRDFRVIGRELNLAFGPTKINATVLDLPFYKSTNRVEVALELFHLGVEAFQSNDIQNAKDYMFKALQFDSGLADAYESLGVILGREERFEEAITWMDELLKVNPKSVMAHTNKSIFLMKLGKIEEAEAEKSKATVKSFAVFGEEAKVKKIQEEEQKKKQEDILRREKMYLQVLEIDELDPIALLGMADIFFQRLQFDMAMNHLEKVISVDKKLSSAYLLLGKTYEAKGLLENAQKIYQAGIDMASSLGDMKPANEMQSRLNQLVVTSRS